MGISIWQLVIILAIVVLLFGTKKLRSMGSDLGGAIKSFRSAVKEGEEAKDKADEAATTSTTTTTAHIQSDKGTVIEGEATREKDKA